MADHLPALLPALFFAGGALGSFFGVCVRRVPAGNSVLFPRSACESCASPVPPFLNIPVAGFAVCRGVCRKCGAKIPRIYPVLEILCAVSAVCAAAVFGLSWEALRCFVLFSALAFAAAFDVETMTVPDFITFPLFGAGIVLSIPDGNISEAALGAAIGGGALLAASFFYRIARKKDGLGAGDVKLMAGAGAFTGAEGAAVAILLASAAGAAGGFAYLKARGMKLSTPLPFAPFIAAGVAAAFLFV